MLAALCQAIHDVSNLHNTHPRDQNGEPAPFFGGMRMAGSSYPVEVPIKIFFDDADDEGRFMACSLT